MENQRNRAEGWSYAKLSGHLNENRVKELFDNSTYKAEFSEKLRIGNIDRAQVGGLHERGVESVLGDKTTSKTDLRLTLTNGSHLNFSIKKSAGGQVFLITVERFIKGYETHFGEIPANVQNVMKLYFAGHPDIDKLLNDAKLFVGQNNHLIAYQKRKKRLVKNTLEQYNQALPEVLLEWFKSNIANIADFCFSKGLALDPKEWAEYLWYKNMVGGKIEEQMYYISDIKTSAAKNRESIAYGTRMGGSTIQLPFGFVQWHQGQMQFHHSQKRLNSIVESK